MAPPRHVVIIFPRKRDSTPAFRSQRERIKLRAESRGFPVREIAAARLSAGSGRRLWVISRGDAQGLYLSLHRAQVAVLPLVHAVVRQDPSRELRDNKVLTVRDFCKHKACVVSLDDVGDAWLGEFDTWCGTPSCDGHGDPRSLPFHIFDVGGATFPLDTRDGRERFNRMFGAPRQRHDRGGRVWNAPVPGQRHGRDPVYVAGTLLASGFHWDVEPARRTTAIISTDAIWTVRGYANVYPDGVIRGGSRCQRSWTPESSAVADRREH